MFLGHSGKLRAAETAQLVAAALGEAGWKVLGPIMCIGPSLDGGQSACVLNPCFLSLLVLESIP